MEQPQTTYNNYSPSWIQKVRDKLFRWIRLSNRPAVKAYAGYCAGREVVVYGHVMSLAPLPRKRYRQNVWTNTLALIRLFMVRTVANVQVVGTFNNVTVTAITGSDGFFKLQWTLAAEPPPGKYEVTVLLNGGQLSRFYGQVTGTTSVYAPFPGQYGIVSDIDDTFLISHSSNLRKRLFVLLTQNAYSRKPFEGVVNHYQLLATAGTSSDLKNPFFYVSSSEWNLYDYIRDFSKKNELPEGVYLLSSMKKLSEAWKTGQNRHGTKFVRIARVLEAYPQLKFILLGDDSQQDPIIYASVASHFPSQIRAVYLRNVFEKNMTVVKENIAIIEALGISVCHFRHSEEAIAHSVSIGLFTVPGLPPGMHGEGSGMA